MVCSLAVSTVAEIPPEAVDANGRAAPGRVGKIGNRGTQHAQGQSDQKDLPQLVGKLVEVVANSVDDPRMVRVIHGVNRQLRAYHSPCFCQRYWNCRAVSPSCCAARDLLPPLARRASSRSSALCEVEGA